MLRKISSCPSRRCAEHPDSARGIACWSGLRCSSTGVPITTTTFSAVPTIDGSAEATRRPSATARSSTGAGARLVERHAAVAHLRDRVRINVINGDVRAPVGEGNRQREPDVAASADDHNIALK